MVTGGRRYPGSGTYSGEVATASGGGDTESSVAGCESFLDDKKSPSIVFHVISDQCATFFVLILFTKWPFWMTENHFRLHFLPFQINTQLFFSQHGNTQLLLLFFHNMATGGHFG